MEKVNKVIILGGTHGDELSGIFLVNKWKKDDEELKSRITSCPVDVHIANPEAVAICRRYKDCDLNHQFTKENYERCKTKTEHLPYEVKRAEELHRMISNGSEKKNSQLILDLHNTTANMGCSIMPNSTKDVFSMHLAAYIQSNLKKDGYKSEILCLGHCNHTHSRTLAEHGLAIEVGPQPRGVLRADIWEVQKQAIFYALQFVEKFNKNESFPSTKVTSYCLLQNADFPDSSATAMIHENIQDKDFKPLSMSEPVFRTMDDEILSLNDVLKADVRPTETVYAVFVNEASYYEKGLAFRLAILEQVQQPPIVAKC